MSKTILIDDEDATKSVYSLNLTTYIGTEVVERKNARDTIDLLEVLDSFDLIVTRASVRGEPTIRKLIDYLNSKNLKIPILLLGDEIGDEVDCVWCLKPPIHVKNLLDEASKILGVNIKEVMEKKVVSEYVPIPIDYFLLMKSTPCEVFIQIMQNTGIPRYVKRIHSQDDISRVVILKYQDSGVKFLYVHEKDRFSFVDDFTEKIIEKLEDENLSVDERVQVAEDASEFIYQEVKNLGIKESLLKTGKAVMNSMLLSVKQNPGLADMLRVLEKNKSGFRYRHCQMLSLVSCAIIQKIDWGGVEFLEKMVFVSLFHDLALEDGEWASIHSQKELDASGLNYRDKENVLNHAQIGAQMIEKTKEVPIGVDQIIRQHHGVQNGIGFTESFPNNLSPLTIVFILAELFVDDMLKGGQNSFDKNKFFGPLLDELPRNFQKPIKALESAFEP